MTTTSATFDDAIRAIRLAAAAADPLPDSFPTRPNERASALAKLPRLSFSFPVPGNPRGMTVSAVDYQETLSALADKLETKARAFGGKPPAKVRKKTRTSGYQAARSAFAEGHHRQVHRSLGDRLAFVIGKNGSLYPVMVVEEFDRAGHTWAIAWPVFGKTRKPILAHVATGVYGSITPDHGDIMTKGDDFFARIASGAPSTAPALDQSAALESFLAADRVESMDAEAIEESEPCDVADAQVALAEKIAEDAAIHSGEDAPQLLADPAKPRHPRHMKIEAITDALRSIARAGALESDEAVAPLMKEATRRIGERKVASLIAEIKQQDKAQTSPSPSPAAAADTAAPRPPRLHQKLAQVPDQNAAHGAGSRMEATTENFTRTDSAPVGTCPANLLPRHRTRWRPRRTEDVRRNPLQAGPIRDHNAMRWREPWDSVAIDPPRTRAGSMPPIHAVATGDRGAYPHHHSIECRYLSIARKLHKPPDPKATHAAGSRRQCQETGSSPPLHHITRASRSLTITTVELPK